MCAVAMQASETAITSSPDSRSKQKALRRLQNTAHLDDLMQSQSTSLSTSTARGGAERRKPKPLRMGEAVDGGRAAEARDRDEESVGSKDLSDENDSEDIGAVDKLSSHIFSTDDYPFPESASSSNGNGSSTSEKLPPLPSLEERALQQQEAIRRFSELLKTLPEKSLNSLYQAVSATSSSMHSCTRCHPPAQGVTFWKGLMTSRSTGAGLDEEVKAKLSYLHKRLKSEVWPAQPSLAPEAEGEAEEEGEGASSTPSPLRPATMLPSTSAKTALDAPSTHTQPADPLLQPDLVDLPADEARKEFLTVLFAAFPYWKYDNFL